jgi:hypothetical protein
MKCAVGSPTLDRRDTTVYTGADAVTTAVKDIVVIGLVVPTWDWLT